MNRIYCKNYQLARKKTKSLQELMKAFIEVRINIQRNLIVRFY